MKNVSDHIKWMGEEAFFLVCIKMQVIIITVEAIEKGNTELNRYKE